MAETFAAIGSASAIVQLVGALCNGLRMLRDAVVAIKDAPKTVQRMEDKIQQLGRCFAIIEQYFQQRPPKIPFEAELYDVVQGLAQSCISSLNTLHDKLPIRSARSTNVGQAFHLWLNDSSIAQARKHIDEYMPYLTLLVQTLNLFKADQIDGLLRDIAAILKDTARQRQPSNDAALYEGDRQAIETTLKVRAFANSAATYVVQSVSTTTAISSRYIATARKGTVNANAARATLQAPSMPRTQRQLEYEWEQNRKALERLVGYRLFESAEKIQQRGLCIREELQLHHNVAFAREERDGMEEQLADILIQCKTAGSTEQALSLLESKLNKQDPVGSLLALPFSPAPRQRRLSLHSKLGRLYKETGQMDRAEEHLRTAFNAYVDQEPQDVEKVREVGEELSELYEYRVTFGDTDHRPVFISQLQGFQREVENVTGRPLEHRASCEKALRWCSEQGFAVSTENAEPRFDILDEDGSSPLHHAAEECHDEEALRQMMEKSDTLENQDENGDTPLLVAAGCSNTTALAVLLQNGASVKARDKQYQTPLHRSQKAGVTKLLLQHRLRRASTVASGPFDDAPVFSSASSTFTTSPPGSIPDQDLEINAQDAHKKTALYLACAQGRDKTVRLLLQGGADPNIAAHDHSPLAATIESQARSYARDPQKKTDIVAGLVDSGAELEPGYKVLRNPRGMQKELRKALQGRTTRPRPGLLSLEGSEDGGTGARRDSGYQPSVSSAATTPQLDPPDLGPTWSPGLLKEDG